MEQVVRVSAVRADGTAQVIRVRESACSGDCRKCGGCGAAAQTIVLTARNPIGAKPGEIVTVRSDSRPVLLAAVMVYVLPLVLFFLGYLLGSQAWGHGALTGCAAFALGILGAAIYDRRVAAKQKNVYTIIGYPARGSWEKEGNDLD